MVCLDLQVLLPMLLLLVTTWMHQTMSRTMQQQVVVQAAARGKLRARTLGCTTRLGSTIPRRPKQVCVLLGVRRKMLV